MMPDGDGSVPTLRTEGPRLIVCKNDTLERIEDYPADLKTYNEDLYQECQDDGFRHIQAAVDAVNQTGTRILVQPGVYHEEPSLAPLSEECRELDEHADEEDRSLTYEEQNECPHVDNVIAVLGDDPDDEGIACGDSETEVLCDLQIEGTGLTREDVLIDGRFQRDNVVRADRADGFYLTNVTIQKSTFNSVYVLETDGFALTDVITRYNTEYGILTFAVDHGLYQDCEAYGNSDAGVYPGSAADLNGVRPAVEITGCDVHHNAVGYSGTAGNSVLAHNNSFHHNAAGISMDSFFPDHPGLPQDSATFVRNEIYSNNENYYDNFEGEDPSCDKPIEERDWSGHGTVCPVVPLPVGTGVMVAGGNRNVFGDNAIYDNWRYGAYQFSVPAAFREETDPTKQLDTSHYNRYIDNRMGVTPDGEAEPNGLDFWWDEGGTGNCWEDNDGGEDGISSDPPKPLLPECGGTPINRPPNAAKLALITPCATYDQETNHHPPGCDWMNTPEEPEEDESETAELPLGLSSCGLRPDGPLCPGMLHR